MMRFNHLTAGSGRITVALAAAVFAVTSIGIFNTRAQAADLEQITISAPSVKTVDHDATGAPIEEVTRTARITVDPVTLTTNSGVALLKDSVQEAAQKVCDSLDPLDSDDGGECVRGAVRSAQAQIAAVVARARANTNS
jgi:UrcA family protein